MINIDILTHLNRELILNLIKTECLRNPNDPVVTNVGDIDAIEYLDFNNIKLLFEFSLSNTLGTKILLTAQEGRELENRFWDICGESMPLEEYIEYVRSLPVLNNPIEKVTHASEYINKSLKLSGEPIVVDNKEYPETIVNEISPSVIFRSMLNKGKSIYTNSDLEALIAENPALKNHIKYNDMDKEEVKRLCDLAYNIQSLPQDYLNSVITEGIIIAVNKASKTIFVSYDDKIYKITIDTLIKIITKLRKVEIGNKNILSRVISIQVNLKDSIDSITLKIPNGIYEI